MRTGNLTGREILEMEMAADKKRTDRNNGLSLMQVRDRGWVRLSNGSKMMWPVTKPEGDFYVYRYIPDGYFELDGKLYNAEEFRRWLRWA